MIEALCKRYTLSQYDRVSNIRYHAGTVGLRIVVSLYSIHQKNRDTSIIIIKEELDRRVQANRSTVLFCIFQEF